MAFDFKRIHHHIYSFTTSIVTTNTKVIFILHDFCTEYKRSFAVNHLPKESYILGTRKVYSLRKSIPINCLNNVVLI